MSGRLATTSHDGVLEVTFENAGRRNALSLSLLSALGRVIDDAGAGEVRAVVLAGAGDGFSAGADLAEVTGTVDDRAVDDAIQGAAASIRDCPAPVIAAVEGPCIGGALDLALSCDAIVAAEGAYFALPATHLGLLYDPRALVRLRHRLGPAALRWLLLLGERIDARTGAAMGLVARRRQRRQRRGRGAGAGRAGIGPLAPRHRGNQAAARRVRTGLGPARRVGARPPRHPRLDRAARTGRTGESASGAGVIGSLALRSRRTGGTR